MRRKIISYIILSIIIPWIICGLLYYLIEPTGVKLYYSAISMVLLFLILFTNMLILDRDIKMNIGYIILGLLIIGYVLYMVLVFDKYLYSIISLIGINIVPVIINKNKLLYFLGAIFIYLNVFNSYSINIITLIIYGVFVLSIFGLTYWYKYRKVKIYLDDNY